jgi:Bifunctional DNA primase/polymerase, N-terminal/Primase C terminal 1 (PriCT-1)
VTGAISGIVALDFDGEEGERLRKRLGLQPNVKTGRGGHHVWFHHPGWYVPTLNSKAKKELSARWPGVDIKGDGGYAITVGRSTFGDYRPLRLQAEFPDRLPLEFRRDVGLLDPPGGPTPELLLDRYLTQAVPGSRNSVAFSLACQLRDNGVDQREAECVLADYARRAPEHDHPYTEAEALASVKAAYGRLPREPWSSAPRLVPSSNGSGPERV